MEYRNAPDTEQACLNRDEVEARYTVLWTDEAELLRRDALYSNVFPGTCWQHVPGCGEGWHEEAERKKNLAYKTDIAPQFEYNRFICDFFSDPSNKGKSREEAIQEWKGIKKCPGSNKYVLKNEKTT